MKFEKKAQLWFWFEQRPWVCDCSVDECWNALFSFLEWCEAEIGGRGLRVVSDVDHVFAGIVGAEGLTDHGIAVRCPALTKDGQEVLRAMREYGPPGLSPR